MSQPLGPTIQVAGLPAIKCGTCVQCCKGDAPPLVVGVDNPMLYEIENGEDRLTRIKKGSDGNCMYLSPRGCMIHNIRPEACRVLDCRGMALLAATSPSHVEKYKQDTRKWKTMLVGRKKLVELFSSEIS